MSNEAIQTISDAALNVTIVVSIAWCIRTWIKYVWGGDE